MAYKKSKPFNPHKENPDDIKLHNFESSHPYRPFSYYVRGGLDVTGEHTDMSAPISYDDIKDISAGCGVDSLTDPKVGFYQVAEDMGVEIAHQVQEKKTE